MLSFFLSKQNTWKNQKEKKNKEPRKFRVREAGRQLKKPIQIEPYKFC